MCELKVFLNLPSLSSKFKMFDIDAVIRNLTSTYFVPLTLTEMKELCKKASEVFMSESMLLELHAPINFVGKLQNRVILQV